MYSHRFCPVQANLDVCRGVAFERPPDPIEQLKEGNYVARSISADSARGTGVEVGARSSIKKSAIGVSFSSYIYVFLSLSLSIYIYIYIYIYR